MSVPKSKLIPFKEIKEELSLIKNSETDYITPSGKVYKHMGNNLYYLKKNRIIYPKGYVYCGITFTDGKNHSCRIHRLIAEAYIPNPDNLPIVGHMNNIKTDNRIENLYWTTYSENTQKAVDDKLLVNDKGYDDSQSNPVLVFDSNHNLIDKVGSMKECAKKYHVSPSTVARQCNHEVQGTRTGYYFEYDR